MPLCNWRYGRRGYTEVRVATAKAVADNYVAGIAADTLVLASDQAWDTNLATTQAAWILLVVGVADQLKAANVARVPGNSEDNIIRCVSDADVYDIPIESTTVVIGDWFGPSKAAGNALVDTSFVKVSGPTVGCFRAVRSSGGVAVTTARCRFISSLNPEART